MKLIPWSLPVLAAALGFALGHRGSPAAPVVAVQGEAASEAPRGIVNEQVAPSPAAGEAQDRRQETPQASSGRRARRAPSLIRGILPLLTEAQLVEAVKSAIEYEGDAWNVAFDFFLSSDNPGFISFAEQVLAQPKRADTADRIAAAFAAEGSPERRAALAVILGRQSRGTVAVHEIDRVLQLMTGDSVDRVMRHLSPGSFEGADHGRIAMRLRDLAVRSQDETVRARSVELLSQDRSEAGVRFLLGRIQDDTNAAFRSAALRCLHGAAPGNVRVESVRVLSSVLTGPSWSLDDRRHAAYVLRELTPDVHRSLLSDELHAVVNELSPPEPPSAD